MKGVSTIRSKKSLYSYKLTYPAIIIYSAFYVLPIIAAFILSFTDWNISRLLAPKFNGLSNFTSLFGDEVFKTSIINTLLFATISTFFKIAFGLLLAVAVVKPLLTRNYLRTLFYMPATLSMVVVGLVFTSILQMSGPLNGLLGLFAGKPVEINWLGDSKLAIYAVIFTEVWKWSGFCMAIFLAGLQSIPRDYYEACEIDGASSFKQFMNITLPLLAPAFTVNITINIIGGLRVFEQVYILTNGGPGTATQVISTYIYSTYGKGMLGVSTALGLLLFLAVGFVSLSTNTLLKKKEVEL